MEFNFRRAHREWAQPLFNRLSAAVRLALQMVIAQQANLRQNAALGIDWPINSPELREAFDALPVDELGRAARVIYYYGHWASAIAVTVHYPGLPPRRFPLGDWQVHTRAEADEWVKAMDSYNCLFGERTEEVRYEYEHAGLDNTKTGGAYWKFAILARQSLQSRGCTKTDEQFEHELGWDSEDFMDHKPGEQFKREDAHVLFRPYLAGKFRPRKIFAYNHKPHPFVIGHRHMAYASEHGGILGEDACRSADCAYGTLPGHHRQHDHCSVPFDQHTCEYGLLVQCLPGCGPEQFKEILQLPEVQELMKQYQIQGVAFQSAAELRPWSVTVRCRALVPFAEQDFDDQQDKPEGTYTFKVDAVDREQAADQALDQFHSTVPIACLDDFEITTEVLPPEQTTNAETPSL